MKHSREFDISASEIAAVIDERVLNERNRKILKRRYIDGLTFEQIAEEFERTDRQIKNIIYKNEHILFKHLKF